MFTVGRILKTPRLVILPFVFCALSPRFSSSEPHSHLLYAKAMVSLQKLGPGSLANSYQLFGLSLGFQVSPSVTVGLSAGFAEVAQAYDIVGADNTVMVNLTKYQLLLELRIGQIASAVDVAVSVAPGVQILSTQERMVSLGGLGSKRIPSQTERNMICTVGLDLSREVVTDLELFIAPAVIIVLPAKLSSVGYSIGGGLSLAIL